MRYNKKYIEKILNDPLPPLEDDEKIYLNVPYMGKGFAKCTNCEYDNVKKLWFTGCYNANLESLVNIYGVNEITSENARKLLQDNIGKGI